MISSILTLAFTVGSIPYTSINNCTIFRCPLVEAP